MMRAALLALILPGAAQATGLNCTFTTICSPQTDCQTSAGVPFTFEVISGTLSLLSPDGPIMGTPLANTSPPALSVIFDSAENSTILLSVTSSGEAVMTQHDIAPGDQIRSVSYFGTCEPGA